MRARQRQKAGQQQGSVLALVIIVMIVLTMVGMGMLKVGQGQLQQAIRLKNQELAFSAAEAAYEKSTFWMSQQVDMLSALNDDGASGTLNFTHSNADYSVQFSTFLGARPVYRITVNGTAGIYQRTITAYVVQAVSGWDVATCKIPSGPNQAAMAYFTTGEVIDMPMHVNNQNDSPDNRDIYTYGTPRFLGVMSLGENRYTASGSDKYNSVMGLFEGGIHFNQPASRIANPDSVTQKVDRFEQFTNPSYRFTPQVVQTLPKDSSGKTGFYTGTVSEVPATQLKFYVKNGEGYVRIYDNCTVAAYTRGGKSNNSWDYRASSGGGSSFEKYGIYGCHYTTGTYTDVRIDDPSSPIYVKQDFGGIESKPGAQIYVDGNVVIGCSQEDAAVLGASLNTVKGQLSVVATGNIWITNSLKVDGSRDAKGVPAADNPNVLGLIASGVIKVADPGMSENGLLTKVSDFNPALVSGYEPIGITDKAPIYSRKLPQTVEVEASLTMGLGGWGAENLYRSSSFTPRKNFQTNKNDTLILRGTRCEAMVGLTASGKNGFLEHDYFDSRMITGIVPGNIWLKGKYVLIPGGWSETSTINNN